MPVAAMQAHNRHLPEGQDFLDTIWMTRRCCRRTWAKSSMVLCLSMIPYGVYCGQTAYKL